MKIFVEQQVLMAADIDRALALLVREMQYCCTVCPLMMRRSVNTSTR